MILFDAIRKRIEDLITERNITQYALAKKIAINQSYLYDVLYKRQKDISLSKLYLICEGLDITIQEFFNNPLFDKANIGE